MTRSIAFIVLVALLLAGCKEEMVPLMIDDLVRMENEGPQELPADGASTTTYRITLDAMTDTSIKVVEFTTTRGTIAGGTTYQAPILSDRTASAVLTASRDVGPCTVRAKVATLSVAQDIEFVVARPHAVDLELSAYEVDTATNAPITLTVAATRTTGEPTEGQTVWFGFAPDTSLTGLVLSASGTIDEDGQSTATLSNPFQRVGTFLIKARMLNSAGDTLQAVRSVVYQ